MKKIGIIIGIVFALILVVFGIRFLMTSSLLIKTNVTPDSVIVDNKEYSIQGTIRLLAGKHTVSLIKDGYKNIDTTVNIAPFKSNELKATFFPTEDSIEKQKAKTTASEFAMTWFNYNNQADLNYLSKNKQFMTDEFYSTNYYMATSRPQDFQGQPALTSTLKSTEITNFADERATAYVEMSSKDSSGKVYTLKATIELTKNNGVWKVGYVKEI